MSFPPHIASVLDQYGVKPATKAALYDLYASLGSEVLEAFADLASGDVPVSEIDPEQLSPLKNRVVESYVRRNHPKWMQSEMTPSLWHPRLLEGRVSGLVRPLGMITEEAESDDDFISSIRSVLANVLPPGQTAARGMLLLGKNAHSGGRFETVSFDVVPVDVEDAVVVALAAGQQHTIPGSVGETSGTINMITKQMLIWEIQSNVAKPAGGGNAGLSKAWRRHRNWHVTTLAAALMWAVRQNLSIYILRGRFLATAHEVNPQKPVADEVVALHDRTVKAVAEGAGGLLRPARRDEVRALVENELANHALSVFIAEFGGEDVFWRLDLGSDDQAH